MGRWKIPNGTGWALEALGGQAWGEVAWRERHPGAQSVGGGERGFQTLPLAKAATLSETLPLPRPWFHHSINRRFGYDTSEPCGV